MKTTLAPKTQTSGSALLTVLVMCGVLLFTVLGYLSLIEHENRMSVRSQTWNLAIAVAEAGIEEGLAHLNQNSGALGCDEWTFDGTFYNLTRTLTNGDSYTVKLNATSDPQNPWLESRGFVNLPAMAQNRPPICFATVGVNAEPVPITRAVRVRANRGSLFIAAMVAKQLIDLKGNGILTDSFDSSDPFKSSNGHYDPT